MGNKVEDTEEKDIMNKLFADIRHGDIDAVKSAISKNPEVVNEMFSGSKPKKDIGQSPLQVALKCAQFDIIDLLLDNGKWGSETNRQAYLDELELQEDSDYNHEIRMVLQEYFRDR